MKKVLLFATIILLVLNGKSQEVFSTFLPNSPYFEGHNIPNPEFQVDHILWNWWKIEQSTTGHEYRYFIQQKSDFVYLPNGKISIINDYELDNANDWKPSARYFFDYDDNNRLKSCRMEEKNDNGWQYRWEYDYSYDEQDHLIYMLEDIYVFGQDDHTQLEFLYSYNDEGLLVDEIWRLINTNQIYYQWKYTYDNGLLSSKCEQYYGYNWSLETYTYENGRLSSSLLQMYNNSSSWYDHGRSFYEYDETGTITTITRQIMDTVWINYDRNTRTYLEDGTLVQDYFEVWQNNEWVAKRACDYIIDDFGNCVDAQWKVYFNNDWVSSQNNYGTSAFFNHAQSCVSSELRDIHITYTHLGINENTWPVSIYPNPGKNTINIRANTPISNIEFYDQTGRRVFIIESPNDNINISNWPSGLYFWKANSDDYTTITGKWVKE
jgi:hypothetical protein